LDKKRYRELMNRYHKAERYCRQHRTEIENAYRKEKPYLTSEAFWRKYLDI
jgi:ABC-type nitrate/sulfonate/bicarbonate transport system substrate-binding protein